MSGDTIGLYLQDALIYLGNGVLIIFYWLAANTPALVSILCAAAIFLFPDQELQARAGFRPMRDDRGGANAGVGGTVPRTAQFITAFALILWIIAQWGMAMPVPWIGAAMWVVGMLVILMMPAQRFNISWIVKMGLLIYALCVIGSRIYLSYTATLTADQWATLIGSSESASMIVASTRGSVNTIVLWALWLVAPLGFFSVVLGQLTVNPGALLNPLAGYQDILRNIRSRQGR